MAVKGLFISCDWCTEETTEFSDEYDAVIGGWYLLSSVEGEGEDAEVKEAAYCSLDCMQSDL